MTELIKQLQELKDNGKLSKENVLALTNIENLFYIISEKKKTNTPNYNNLYSVFDEIRTISIEQEGMNIFEEFLTLKYFYLEYVYSIENVLLDSLMTILGPVLLDYELDNKFLKEDDFFEFYITRYNQFKQNNEFSMLKLINSFKLEDLRLEGANLQSVIQELKESMNIQ